MQTGMARAAALALLAASALAGQDVQNVDPVELLMRLRDQVMANSGRIPNYTCVETIRRDRYEYDSGPSQRSCDGILARRRQADFVPSLKLIATDRLRLDVAYTGDREIFSWAGASRFEDGEIDELVREGPMGTGPFASMLVAIFSEGARFTFEGERKLFGRDLMEYSFRVTEDLSRYRVRTLGQPKRWLITAYTGTLLLDPGTAELVQATVRTAELRPETALCETNTALEFGKVRLEGVSYLLPKSAHQRFIGRTGVEGENTISFSACREFRAESEVAFGSPGKRISGASYKPDVIPLPAGLRVLVELVTSLDGALAAAGDRIEGRLVRQIETEQKRTLVVEGAAVEGRLMRVENRHSPSEQLTIALRWETIDIDGVKTPLSLRPDRHASAPRIDSQAGLRRRGEEFELPAPGEDRYVVLHFNGSNVQVPGGLRSEWLTVRP